jgi:hypothetical protein
MMLPAPRAALASPVVPADVAGTWYTRIENNAVNCGAGETIDGQVISITQDSADITMLTSKGDTFVGTVNGDIVEWTGSYSERGGTSDFTAATLVFSADSGAGNAAWTWSDGTDSCNGTMAISAVKDAAVGESFANSRPDIADTLDFIDSVAFIYGSLGVGMDVNDFFKFTATNDGVVQVELSHFDTVSTDLDLQVLDEGLNEVAMSASADSFEMVEFSVQAGSTYYIGVESRILPGAISYNLTVDVN